MLPRSCSAFTLFEALVALAVFSFSVMGFMMTFDSTLSAAREARRESIIRQIMEDRIAWLEHAELQKSEQEIDGVFPGMKIRETIEPKTITDDEKTILQGFWKMTVKVSWPRDGKEESLESHFLRYGQ